MYLLPVAGLGRCWAQQAKPDDHGEEGPSVGDLYALSGPLYDESEDTELGRFDGVCTTTSSPGPSEEARRLCNVLFFVVRVVRR